MRISYPLIITPRLLPGAEVSSDSYISIEYASRRETSGRTRYNVYIDLPDGTEHLIDDIRSGCQGGDLVAGLRAALSFLSAAAESAAYARRTGRPGENAALFTPAVVAWAEAQEDNLSMLALELDENTHAIIED